MSLSNNVNQFLKDEKRINTVLIEIYSILSIPQGSFFRIFQKVLFFFVSEKGYTDFDILNRRK